MSEKTCFIMMPFDDRFQSYYERIFSAAAQYSGLRPIKVDEIYTPTQISDDIFRLIRDAEIILADVTGKNPNVNYELGIAHALGKKTVIITQNGDDVPFDYRHLRYIQYNTQYAGWEEKLLSSISRSIRSALDMNKPTTNITGHALQTLFGFLEDTALDASYEISKVAHYQSDLSGNCRVQQTWYITAKSDVTHFIHGVIGDEPGAIHLERVYDKSSGAALHSLTSIGNQNRARYIIFLNKMLKSGESLAIDIDFSADNYLAHLYSMGGITMFQRANTRRGVLYSSRQDIYTFPETPFTRMLTAKCDGSGAEETVSKAIQDGQVTISVGLRWEEPYAGNYSYEIS